MAVDICSIVQFTVVLTDILSHAVFVFDLSDLKAIILLGGEIIQRFICKSQEKTTNTTLYFVVRYKECSTLELVHYLIDLIATAVRRINDQVSPHILWNDCFASSWTKDDAIAIMKLCPMPSAVRALFSVPLSQRELSEFSLFDVSFFPDEAKDCFDVS